MQEANAMGDLIEFLDAFDQDPRIAELLPAAREEVRAYLAAADEIASLRARVAELEEALDWALPYAQSAATDEEGLAFAERAALSAAGNGE